jgi:hypothetical protein
LWVLSSFCGSYLPRTTTTTTVPQAELCDDCADNDGGGAIDLADAACGATGLVVSRAVVNSGKARTSTDDRVTVRVDLPAAIGDVSRGVYVALAGTGAPTVCQTVPASAFRGNRKRTVFTYRRPGTGLVLLRLAQRRGRTQAFVRVKGIPSADRSLALSLAVGDARYRGAVPLRPRKKKLVFP